MNPAALQSLKPGADRSQGESGAWIGLSSLVTDAGGGHLAQIQVEFRQVEYRKSARATNSSPQIALGIVESLAADCLLRFAPSLVVSNEEGVAQTRALLPAGCPGIFTVQVSAGQIQSTMQIEETSGSPNQTWLLVAVGALGLIGINAGFVFVPRIARIRRHIFPRRASNVAPTGENDSSL
jgi:hypothetical protein